MMKEICSDNSGEVKILNLNKRISNSVWKHKTIHIWYKATKIAKAKFYVFLFVFSKLKCV